MKLIRKKDIVNYIYDDYITGEKTIGECIEECHTYNVDEDRICEICASKDCDGCPIRKVVSE